MRITRSQLGDAALAVALVVIGIFGTAAVGADASGALSDRPVDTGGYALVTATAGRWWSGDAFSSRPWRSRRRSPDLPRDGAMSLDRPWWPGRRLVPRAE
jgi:hypothetical protein